MPACLLCEHPIQPFIDFGPMPIANGFLVPEQIEDEPFAPLRVGFCDACKMVQLTELVEPEQMFHDNYAFFTSSSAWMCKHFAGMAAEQQGRWLAGRQNPFVVEIGSNDGSMLLNFAEHGIKHLGIEPSGNVAQVAQERGVDTTVRFFGLDTAREISAEKGHADLFLATNVMCHIPDLNGVFAGIEHLLVPDGVLVFEDPYLGDIVQKTAYDQIYDEHAFYFCITSLEPLLKRHGLEIIRVEPQSVHGGSMRYTVGKLGAHPVHDSVPQQLEIETELGLGDSATYERFRKNVEASRDELMAELDSLRAEGIRVVGYGATSKSTTVTNYCGITPDHVAVISDTTPLKQGKLSPGAHIPVVPYETFQSNPPAVALLFAWNHEAEILAKEQTFIANGGRFLRYVPKVGYTKAVEVQR